MYIPIVGIILKLYNIGYVDKKHLVNYLQEGINMSILPGGFEE